MTAAARRRRQPVVAARVRPAPPAGVVEESRETHRRRRSAPAERGRLHRRRHRGGQPRGQGPLLGAPRPRTRAARRILASAVEHHAVLDAAALAGRARGRRGRVAAGRRAPAGSTPTTLRGGHRSATPASVALVTVMWANNEVGTVQPVAELAAVAHAHGIPVHTDAVQAVGQVPVDFAASGVDALTVTGHKLGGPLGVGALRRSAATLDLTACCTAAARSATSAPAPSTRPAIVGLRRRGRGRRQAPGRARRAARPRCATTWCAGCSAGRARRRPQRRPATDRGHRLPGNAHFSFPGCEGDALLMLLDARGIECSTGSACSAGVAAAVATCCSRWAATRSGARGSLRFSLGHTSHRGRRRRAGRGDRPGRRAGRAAAGAGSARREGG